MLNLGHHYEYFFIEHQPPTTSQRALALLVLLGVDPDSLGPYPRKVLFFDNLCPAGGEVVRRYHSDTDIRFR